MELDSLNNNLPTRYDFGGITVLLAEDDHINMLLLQRALENANVKVLLANNGAEAVGFVNKDSSIRAILMDLKMPVMDGLEALQTIKLIHPKLPIIAQTAYNQIDERNKAVEAGCDAYLTKPINIPLLYKTLQQLL